MICYFCKRHLQHLPFLYVTFFFGGGELGAKIADHRFHLSAELQNWLGGFPDSVLYNKIRNHAVKYIIRELKKTAYIERRVFLQMDTSEFSVKTFNLLGKGRKQILCPT